MTLTVEAGRYTYLKGRYYTAVPSSNIQVGDITYHGVVSGVGYDEGMECVSLSTDLNPCIWLHPDGDVILELSQACAHRFLLPGFGLEAEGNFSTPGVSKGRLREELPFLALGAVDTVEVGRLTTRVNLARQEEYLCVSCDSPVASAGNVLSAKDYLSFFLLTQRRFEVADVEWVLTMAEPRQVKLKHTSGLASTLPLTSLQWTGNTVAHLSSPAAPAMPLSLTLHMPYSKPKVSWRLYRANHALVKGGGWLQELPHCVRCSSGVIPSPKLGESLEKDGLDGLKFALVEELDHEFSRLESWMMAQELLTQVAECFSAPPESWAPSRSLP